MRTVVLNRWDGDGQLLVTVYDDGSVTVADRGAEHMTWGPPSGEVVADEGDMPSFAIVSSFGMIPELWTFSTEAEAQEEWNSQVDGWLREGISLCTGDEPCSAGVCARWDTDKPHTAEELHAASFVTDWNDRELRKEF